MNLLNMWGGCYLIHSWEDKGVHIFPKGICQKVNVIAPLEFELAYYDSAVHFFNPYTTRTPTPAENLKKILMQLEIRKSIVTIQTAESLKSTRILRRVLETLGDLLLLRLQWKWKTTSWHMYHIISYLLTPPLGQDVTQGQFLSRV